MSRYGSLNPENLNSNKSEDQPAVTMQEPVNMGQVSVQIEEIEDENGSSTGSTSSSRRVSSKYDIANIPGAGVDQLRAGMYDEWFKKHQLGLIEKTDHNPAALNNDNNSDSISASSGSKRKDCPAGSEDRTPEEDQDAVIADLIDEISTLVAAIVKTNDDLDAANEVNVQLFKRYRELKGAQDASKL